VCALSDYSLSYSDFEEQSEANAPGYRCQQESWKRLRSQSNQEKAPGVLQVESGQITPRNGPDIHGSQRRPGSECSSALRRVVRIFQQEISFIGRYAIGRMIRLYQLFISPIFPSACRFYPTCSEYGMEAVQRHGILKGSWLTLRRLSRCRPFGPGGYDPVP
jgi:putative membrane protein insertion efficiency factor